MVSTLRTWLSDLPAADLLRDSDAFVREHLAALHRHTETTDAGDAFKDANAVLRLPHFDASFALLFRHLKPQRALAVLEALVLERKILFVSHSLTLLTTACECFRVLLYPFTWNYLYVPFLPPPMFQ